MPASDIASRCFHGAFKDLSVPIGITGYGDHGHCPIP